MLLNTFVTILVSCVVFVMAAPGYIQPSGISHTSRVDYFGKAIPIVVPKHIITKPIITAPIIHAQPVYLKPAISYQNSNLLSLGGHAYGIGSGLGGHGLGYGIENVGAYGGYGAAYGAGYGGYGGGIY